MRTERIKDGAACPLVASSIQEHVTSKVSENSDCELLFTSVHKRFNSLVAIKLFHTVIWVVLAGCILALPLTPC
jgi:hypothetical protein